jgi:hypothetical protein
VFRFLTGILLCVSAVSYAQVYDNKTAIVIPAHTAFALQSLEPNFMATISIGNRSFDLEANEHNSTETWASSAIYYTDTSVQVKLQNSAAVCRWVMVKVPTLMMNSRMSSISRRADCSMPEIILQTMWRNGLPAPTPGRNRTPTSHCIVHHSAANNGDTNYTQIIRSIYTYHTQVNGWDDIGYNYLITANGAVYAGRDPELPGIDQDNVQGAHFCGKNQGTMGTCLVGDFTSTSPSDTQIAALTQLLKWKVKKDALSPYNSKPHPGMSDPLLGVIAGHRDGCNTACPGNKLYEKLGTLKTEVNECSPSVGMIEPSKNPWTIYTQNGMQIIELDKVSIWEIYNLQGQVIQQGIGDVITSKAHHLFVLKVWQDGRAYSALLYNWE